MLAILESYHRQLQVYSDFTDRMRQLVAQLIRGQEVRVHSITARVKDLESLRAKLARPGKHYSALQDVTDISGVRVITYFEDDVDVVAGLIEAEFEIDRRNSVDKRALLDPDRFGYLSLHYVCRLSTSRRALAEYRAFSDLRCELQIRSILQHTWAEIEHDLGYKSKQAVPREIQRAFSRVAGMLEVADDEFVKIRDQLVAYAGEVPRRIADSAETVLIDQASLAAYVRGSPLVRTLDSRIAGSKGRLVFAEGYMGSLVKYCQSVGQTSIGDLEESLKTLGEIVAGFGEQWIRARDVVPEGICLFYLCYVLVARDRAIDGMASYLNANEIGSPDERQQAARDILETYTRLSA